jgi:hypothetical protein
MIPPQPNITQLMQLVIQLQAQQMQQQQAPPPPVAPMPPCHIKAALPTKFDGSPSKASSFINTCENYFILNLMTPEQQVRFALALTEGRAEHWTRTSLDSLNSLLPPPWEHDWDLFKGHFNLRFQDRQERDRAVYDLMNNKVVQITSVREFIDKVRDTCQKAGWADKLQWRDVVMNGLKREVTMALAGRFPWRWDDFVLAVEQTDKDLQHLKERERPAKKSTPSTSRDKKEAKPDQSKYKLSDSE